MLNLKIRIDFTKIKLKFINICMHLFVEIYYINYLIYTFILNFIFLIINMLKIFE